MDGKVLGRWAEKNKVSQYIPCLTARKPGPDRSQWIRIGQRDPRLSQITELDQRLEVVLEGLGVGIMSRRVQKGGRGPSGNPAINTLQLVLPGILREPFKGFQALAFVPFDRPLLRLGKEVSDKADHHCSNRSDQQALTHIGSVRERDAKTSLSLALPERAKFLRRRDVGFADCSLNSRQVRRGGNNINDSTPLRGDGCADGDKASPCLHRVAAKIPGRRGSYRARISQQYPRPLQITQLDQRVEMVIEGAEVVNQGVRYPEGLRPSGNSAVSTLQLVLPCVLSEPVKGFQVLGFVPFDRPFPGLGKEVNHNANHRCSNRSDQQALTHGLLALWHVGPADRILPKTHVLRWAYDRHRALVRQFDHARQKRPCISFPSSSLIGALRQNCILEGTDICQWKLVFHYVTRRDESCPMTFNFGPQRFAMIQHLRWSNPSPSGFPVRGLPNAVDQSLPVYPFKGREVLSLVPLDRPLLRLGEEVNRNANHHCSNRSDQQALTHIGSVRERTG